MSKERHCTYMICLMIGSVVPFAVRGGAAAAEMVPLSKTLTVDDVRCATQLLSARYEGHLPTEIPELLASARVGRAALRPKHQKAYIFLFEHIGWCGTAGCWLIIGEKRSDRRCHLLYDSDGDEHAIEVLHKRDYGYRRVYTPCEARFDGRQYRQIREECPNANVHR